MYVSENLTATPALTEDYVLKRTGDVAPDFELTSHDERTIRLTDFRGKRNVVLAFFPLAWTPV